MDINFEYDGVTASDRLEIMMAEKLDKLSNKYEFMIRADVFFTTENTSDPETGMICKIKASMPGPLLFAESSHKNFETAIAESVSDLERQLRKKKTKMQSHH
jgi:putative sigma-54 modulation protein